MNSQHRLRVWQRAAMAREWLIGGACLLPMLAGLFGLVYLRVALLPALGAALLGLAAGIWWLQRQVARLNNAWLIRCLDGQPALQNSSDLFFREPINLSNLQALQLARIQAHVQTMPALDLRRAWPWPRLLLCSVLAALLFAFGYWPDTSVHVNALPMQTHVKQARASALVVEAYQLRISPPAYTGLPARTVNSLQAQFIEGSRLQWQLQFNRPPKTVRLLFFAAPAIVLRASGDVWRAEKPLFDSEVYRIEADGQLLFDGKWKRLDVQKDQAPQWRVLAPEGSLSWVSGGQSHWPMVLEASDDFGLGNALMQIQLAQGSGETIQFKQFTRPLPGQGTAKQRRYQTRLDLAEIGMQVGDDLIVQFSVSDNRQPKPQLAVSASYILRWSANDGAEASGVEGMLKKVMPAYFRSQRQIIIDTEKLLNDRKRYSAEQFSIRSDTIGVDQRLLRLRYGQFLGEETESPEPVANSEQAHSEGDGHDHAENTPAVKKPTAPTSQSVLEEFGHTHDIPEAATLLDPGTRTLLRSALNAMWQAELHLRIAEPKKALPFEYRALDFIKKVQQGSRIYLARVGPELPPIDESRRLSGERGVLPAPVDGLLNSQADDAPLQALWQSVQAGTPADMPTVRAWIAKHPERIADGLALKVALAEWQAKPDCAACAEALQALLWPILSQPLARPTAREQRSADQRYRALLRASDMP